MSHRGALPIVNSVIGLLVGLFIAFAGYRLARSFAMLAGFLIGFSVGLVVGIAGGPVVAVAVAVVMGILFALLFRFAFRFVGAALGGAVGYTLAAALSWPIWLVVIAVIVGIGVGFAANKIMIILATAALGAWLATRSAFELLHDVGVALPWDREVAGLITASILAVLGALAQWRSLKGID